MLEGKCGSCRGSWRGRGACAWQGQSTRMLFWESLKRLEPRNLEVSPPASNPKPQTLSLSPRI